MSQSLILCVGSGGYNIHKGNHAKLTYKITRLGFSYHMVIGYTLATNEYKENQMVGIKKHLVIEEN